MDPGDIVFYGIIIVSVLSSILKAVKRKPESGGNTGMPDFKGSSPREIFKTILEEMGEKEDDFIPSNPKPVSPPVIKTPSGTAKAQPYLHTERPSGYERTRMATENMPR
ncbi:MAG: hypothetical protein PHS30_09200, partial [Bacteroidales bacterium]|nr:hypothetical protein [Bacteroidales bacterium]